MIILKSVIKDIKLKKQLLLRAHEFLNLEFVNIIKETAKNNATQLVIIGSGLKKKMRRNVRRLKFWMSQSTFWKRNGKSYSEQ